MCQEQPTTRRQPAANSLNTAATYLFQIHFSIIPTLIPSSPQWFLTCWYSDYILCMFTISSCVVHAPKNTSSQISPPYFIFKCGMRWQSELKVRRSRVRFPMGPLRFFIDLTFRPYYGSDVDSASNRNEHQGYLLG